LDWSILQIEKMTVNPLSLFFQIFFERSLLLFLQLTTNRTAELSAGYRGRLGQGGRREEGDGVSGWRCGEGARKRASLPDFVGVVLAKQPLV
jgi:hypothetical protein